MRPQHAETGDQNRRSNETGQKGHSKQRKGPEQDQNETSAWPERECTTRGTRSEIAIYRKDQQY